MVRYVGDRVAENIVARRVKRVARVFVSFDRAVIQRKQGPDSTQRIHVV